MSGSCGRYSSTKEVSGGLNWNYIIFTHMVVSCKMGEPQHGWYLMGNLIWVIWSGWFGGTTILGHPQIIGYRSFDLKFLYPNKRGKNWTTMVWVPSVLIGRTSVPKASKKWRAWQKWRAHCTSSPLTQSWPQHRGYPKIKTVQKRWYELIGGVTFLGYVDWNRKDFS